MRFAIAAALALAAASSLPAQPVVSMTDLSYAPPIGGSWVYATTPTGSESTFTNVSGQPQVTVRCTRATRRIAILKPATAPATTLWVWTSAQAKNLAAGFDPSSGRVTAELGAYDPFLDMVASSRGRIGFSTPGVAPLVVPPWSEVGRVIEDCRV